MDSIIHHDQEAQQFTKEVEGKTCFLTYTKKDKNILDFRITFVPPELRGRHIGDEIVKYALDYVEKHQYLVIPTCPFVQRYIDRHVEYNKLVTK